MKVKDLIKELQSCDPEDEVVMSKDSEGNSYSPLSSIWEGIYVPDSTWHGDVYMRELTEEDKKAGYTNEDLYDGDDGVRATVLSPTN